MKGAAELHALPADVLAVSSRRRAQVQAAIDAREGEIGRPLTRAERSQWGAIATRDRKQYGIETHTFREEIAARAAEHGLDRELVERVITGGVDRLESGEIPSDGTLELAREPVAESEFGRALAGPSGLTEFANTFDGWSVLREFAAASAQGARVDTVRELGERFAARDDVLATTRGTLTSADLVECERALIETATARAGEGVARLPERSVAAAIDASARALNRGQAAAVRAVAGSGNGADVIEALVGSGKTYAAGVLRELYEATGYTVIGVTPSARAARELAEQAGIPARTLDSRLLAIASGRRLPERCVVVFDEAAMASTRQTERLLAHAAWVGAKVVAIGDPGQLPSVQAGGWLRAVGARLGAVKLTEVMRQRDAAERFALAGLRDGEPQRWLEWAAPASRVEVLPDGAEILDQAVAEWAAGVQAHGLEQSVLIARDNDTRRALNRLARKQRREAGALGEDRVYGPVTVAVGDRVICRCNERDLDVDNGTRGIVRHADRRGVVLETDAHTKWHLPASYVAEHVEHAYALIGHGMQGGTVEHAIVVASVGELTRGWSYTALSRARGETRLLVRAALPTVGDRETSDPTRRGRSRPRRCSRGSRGGCSSATTRTSPSTSSRRPGAPTTRSSTSISDPSPSRRRRTPPSARSRPYGVPGACRSLSSASGWSDCAHSSPCCRRASSRSSATSTRGRSSSRSDATAFAVRSSACRRRRRAASGAAVIRTSCSAPSLRRRSAASRSSSRRRSPSVPRSPGSSATSRRSETNATALAARSRRSDASTPGCSTSSSTVSSTPGRNGRSRLSATARIVRQTPGAGPAPRLSWRATESNTTKPATAARSDPSPPAARSAETLTAPSESAETSPTTLGREPDGNELGLS